MAAGGFADAPSAYQSAVGAAMGFMQGADQEDQTGVANKRTANKFKVSHHEHTANAVRGTFFKPSGALLNRSL